MKPFFDLSGLDARAIGRLMDLLSETDVEECQIEQGDLFLAVRRAVQDAPDRRALHASPPAPEEAPREAQVIVKAPAVGVFTRGERAASTPKVEVGDRVSANDVIGFIEVMMVPHSVHTDCDGIVESFLVEDGEPVEYGQPLVTLRPL